MNKSEKLADLVNFCTNKSECRRVLILKYFDEIVERNRDICSCDNCSNFNINDNFDATSFAKIIVNCVSSCKTRLTKLFLIDLLFGARNKNSREKNLDKDPQFGKLSLIMKKGHWEYYWWAVKAKNFKWKILKKLFEIRNLYSNWYWNFRRYWSYFHSKINYKITFEIKQLIDTEIATDINVNFNNQLDDPNFMEWSDDDFFDHKLQSFSFIYGSHLAESFVDNRLSKNCYIQLLQIKNKFNITVEDSELQKLSSAYVNTKESFFTLLQNFNYENNGEKLLNICKIYAATKNSYLMNKK